MSFLGRIASIATTVLPAVIAGPAGYVAAAAAGTVAAGEAKKEAKKKQASLAQERETQMAEIFTGSNLSSIQPNVTANAQPPGFFDRLSSFGSRVGTSSLNILENVLPGVITGKLLGQPLQRTNQGPAVATTLNVGAQESSGSGSIQAGMGAGIGGLVSLGSRFLRSPTGQIGLGTAVGGGLSLFGGDQRQMRITRKMKSQARMVLNLTGGNISAAADILGIDDNTLVMILLKRFRNDGPVITKAALRKTRQTMRRLKSMCDMQSDLLPKTTRRRAPMKRATTTTLIKN
jgi:hypothetical protein